MGIQPTPTTAANYNPWKSLQYNLNAGVVFQWHGGRGGEIGMLQSLYMRYLRSGIDGRWILNIPISTEADMASADETMRAHHVSDSVIKKHIVNWVNAGMTLDSFCSILQDVSSVNSLTFPDIVFPEKVALIWLQWLVGWGEAISSFLLSASSMPCAAVLWFAEALVANMSTAIANFRPGFGLTDAGGVAAAICPREATAPNWSAFNKMIFSLSGYTCGRIAIESLWVSTRFSAELNSVNLNQNTENQGMLIKHKQPKKQLVSNSFNAPISNMALPLTTHPNEIYSSERRTSTPLRHGMSIINTGAPIVLPNAAQQTLMRNTVILRNMIVTVPTLGLCICLYFLFPVITLLISLGYDKE